VKTTKRVQAINITEQVADAIRGKGGNLLHVYTPHTTCGLCIMNRQTQLIRDIMDALTGWRLRLSYRHLEGNSDAHIKAVLTGSSVSIPISEGKMKLGTWQGIFYMEFDGPRGKKGNINLSLKKCKSGRKQE
jgi:secondary thiamine-phosphate synthase enzyme